METRWTGWRRATQLALGLFTMFATGCGNSDEPGGSAAPDAGTCEQGTQCGSACVDLSKNTDHCGACGVACNSSELCSGGSCVVSCQAGLTACNGYCANLRKDVEDCGGCGIACGPGEVCSDGTCATSCQVGLEVCDGVCVDPLTDHDNCGSCGNACSSGELCSNGGCAVSCQAALDQCDGLCVNQRSNRSNCGGCGNVCGSGQVCSDGDCAVSCQAGLTECDGTCADTRTDNAHCGACGTRCAPGTICSDGSCETTCQQGLTECAGVCVDTLRDAANCGTCEKTCGAGQVCSGGACALSCPASQLDCNGSCIDPQTDERYCGAEGPCATNPGAVCLSGYACNAGVCEVSCGTGATACGTPPVCTNTNFDPLNCGTCSNACASVANAQAVCVAGGCSTICSVGWSDCDGLSANGCESQGACSLVLVARAVLDEYGMSEIDERFSEDEIALQSTFTGDVTFEEALRAALDSWLTDGSDPESPYSVLDQGEPDTVCPTGTVTERVLCHMNRPTSRIGLSYSDVQVHNAIYPPEHAEDIGTYWVFFFQAETLGWLHWAVVARQRDAGNIVVYNYGFN